MLLKKNMVVSDNNKASFFNVRLLYPVTYIDSSESIEDKITIQMDLLFTVLNASQIYKFKDKNKQGLINYYFFTRERKRKGQIIKNLKNYVESKNLLSDYIVKPLLKSEFDKIIKIKINKKNINLLSNPSDELDNYNGEDLQILNDKKNWYPWQLDLYDKLFYQSGEIRKARQREIIYIWDEYGCCGKSSFYKYLNFTYYNQKSITYLSLGTSSQLRSALFKCSHRQIYICDLPRSLSTIDKNTVYSLLGAVEDLKNGVICSHMYGEYNLKLFLNPHVILSSNMLVDINVLSKDRWTIYKINKKLELVDITKKAPKLYLQREKDKKKHILPNIN